MKRSKYNFCLGALWVKPSKLASLLVFAISIIFASHVIAYQVNTYLGKEIKWNDLDIPVTYYINQNGTPDCTGEFVAIQAAYQTWENVTSAYMDFTYGGTTTNSSWGANDGINLNVWIEAGWATATGTNSSTIAVNRIWFYVGDTYCYLVDSDIAYNGEDFIWSTAPAGEPGKMDVQNIATHETGHSLSLADLYGSTDTEKTMYGYSSYGEIKKRTLDPDDEAGIAYLYPVTGDVTPPTMEPIYEPQSQYYNSAPAFSNFGFDDETALDDGWYQMDSYTGTWTSLFTNVVGTSWDYDGWIIPGFDNLTEGSHTIYFKASDDSGNVEGESGEWSWQFYKDTAPPNGPTNLASSSHSISTWSNNNTVEVTWTAATDPSPGSGLDGYSILWDTYSTTVPDATKDIEETTTSTTSTTLADGNSHYFHIRSVDNVGNWQDAVHIGPFYIDGTNPTITYNYPLAGGTTNWYSSDPGTIIDIDFGWIANSPLDYAQWRLGTGSWNYVFDVDRSSDYTVDWGIPWDSLAEGENEISIKVADKAGNVVIHNYVSGVSGFLYKKDITPPGVPTISSLTHPSETTWYNSNNISLGWIPPSDLSGIGGYSYLLDQIPSTIPDTISDGIDTVKSYINIANGIWYFHCRAHDNANNWGMPGHRKIMIDIEEPTIPTLIYPDSGRFIYDTIVSFAWQASIDTLSGINFYLLEYADNYDFLDGSTVQVYDTTYTASFTDTTYYWRVKAVDAATNESDWSVISCFTVKTGCDISGNISYYSNELPVGNTTILLVDGAIDTVYSDANGNYLFSNLTYGLSYTVYPMKKNNYKDVAITPFDASYALRFYVGLIDLDPYQRVAADVTGNGHITAFDASYIMRYYVGLIDSFPVGKDWSFVPVNFPIDTTNWMTAPDSICYPTLDSDQFDQDYKGVLYGDITGNWTSSKALTLKSSPSKGYQESEELPSTIKIVDSTIISKPGSIITLPIAITGITELYSVGITIEYNSEVLKVIEVSKTELTKDYIITYNANGNILRIALAGTRPISSGKLMEVKFRVANNVNLDAASHIVIAGLQIDEKSISERRIIKFKTQKANFTPYVVIQNYPNPFCHQTVIRLQTQISNSQLPITVTIYDLAGRLICTLIGEPQQNSGYYTFVWDGKDELGRDVTNGVYFYRMQICTDLESDSYTHVNKIILLR
ncbi:MAG TPA: matrixin family metalloprotease [bacterium (Candidatus Stahlbacteria)]|nr:matrixin family metalloprotease [Candidatus Stahlbacteria bacterium]